MEIIKFIPSIKYEQTHQCSVNFGSKLNFQLSKLTSQLYSHSFATDGGPGSAPFTHEPTYLFHIRMNYASFYGHLVWRCFCYVQPWRALPFSLLSKKVKEEEKNNNCSLLILFAAICNRVKQQWICDVTRRLWLDSLVLWLVVLTSTWISKRVTENNLLSIKRQTWKKVTESKLKQTNKHKPQQKHESLLQICNNTHAQRVVYQFTSVA